ncbi:MAG: hypothetical protein IJQ12_09155 [Lachnospiraceae bacterium]|nr:hypothetical protein [Lachnospiraceae bacterium]
MKYWILKVVLYILILLGISGLDLSPAFSRENSLMIQYGVYCVMIVLWSVSAGRRISGVNIRRIQKLVVTLFILLLFLGRLRQVVFAGVYPAEHLLWYMYYIPNLLIPLLSWYMTLYVGREESDRLPARARLLILPYIAIIAVILTNEYHQLAFRFDVKGIPVANAGSYHLGPVYFVAQIWIFGFACLAITSLYRTLKRNHLRAYALPFVAVVATGLIYTALYATDRSPGGFGYIEPDVMSCFPTLLLWELCIVMRLIPSNSGYGRRFNACTVPMEILDNRGEIHFRSGGYAEKSQAGFPGEKSVLPVYITRQFPISGGVIRWREDVTRISALITEREEVASHLLRSNERLEAQNRMRMQSERTRENARLYDRALGETGDRIARIRRLVEECRTLPAQDASEEKRKRLLSVIGVLGAYVKRRSNLVLLSDKAKDLPVTELHFCLHESNEALVLIPVSTIYRNETDGRGVMPAHSIMRIYDAFQIQIEEVLDDLEFLRMTLLTTADEVCLSLRMGLTGGREKELEIKNVVEGGAV